MKLGFVGYGEAAYEMSKGLSEEGLEYMVAYDVLWNDPSIGNLIKQRAEETGVKMITSLEETVKNLDVVIVAVPANKAHAVCQSLLPFIKENSLYVDVSAASPDIKIAINEELEQNDIEFVDIAMMGPLSVYKHKVPILASGKGAERFQTTMSTFGMDIERISDVAGEASATKLIRSIFMKGISTLLLEMLTAANSFNVEKQVISSIAETMNKSDFESTMNRLITGTAIHSERRSTELEGTLKLLQNNNLSSSMTVATKATLDKVTALHLRDKLKGVKPESWEEVIAATTAQN